MPKPVLQVLVCCNERPADASKPSCLPRGAVEVYHRFKDRVKQRGLRQEVMVTRTGCLKHCSRGVTVALWPQNAWLAGVTVGDVDDILDCAARGEEGPARLKMPDIPWE